MFEDWGFYQVVIGVIGILLALAGGGWTIFERYRNRKNLSYSREDSFPLIAQKSGSHGLSVMFQDKHVRSPHLTTFEFRNSGWIAITPADFVAPLTIHSNPDALILSASVSSQNPAGINPNLHIHEARVIVDPLLLNGGDSFNVNILTDGAFDSPQISARVAGVSKIEAFDKRRPLRMRRGFLALIIGLIILLSLLADLSQIFSKWLLAILYG